MLKFILLFLVIVIGGCGTTRRYLITPQAPPKTFERLNRDLAQPSQLYIVPDSVSYWNASHVMRDSVAVATDQTTQFVSEASMPTEGETLPQPVHHVPVPVRRIFVTPDSVFYAFSTADSVVRRAWRDVEGVVCEEKHRSIPLGLARGVVLGPGAGALVVSSVFYGLFSTEDEEPTPDEWEIIRYSAVAGAGLGLIIGIISGFTDPAVLSETTFIKLERSPRR